MPKTVSLYDAKTRLSALVEEAAEGDEIVIAKNGRPRARLVRLSEDEPAVLPDRPLGLYADGPWAVDDAGEPLPDDIIDAMLHGDDELFREMKRDEDAGR